MKALRKNKKLKKVITLGTNKKRYSLVLFALLFMIIGASYTLLSQAATPVASFEVENATKSGTATNVADANASGAQALKFGPEPVTSGVRFAGHVPGRVFLGMAASETMRPTYDEALTITGPVYERRSFKSSWITSSAANSMLNDCDANNQYCVISFKVPNNNWAGVAAGQYDADLDIMMNVARSRSKPFAFGVHHEPQGDGVAAEWAAMQEYLVEYLAPVNDKMAFTTIGNGFWWGPNFGETDTYIATYYPQSLLNKMNQYKGLVAADFYDAEPDANGNYKANADRTSMKLQGFVDWARAKGVKNTGVGEFGTTTGAELTKSWKVIHDNRDIFGYANYFNSLANSRWDWRLIPDGYPIYQPTNALDEGGTPVTQARLDAFKAAVIQSSTPQ